MEGGRQREREGMRKRERDRERERSKDWRACGSPSVDHLLNTHILLPLSKETKYNRNTPLLKFIRLQLTTGVNYQATLL